MRNLRSIGLPEVKRYKTDNAAGDGNLQKMHFPELRKEIVEHALPNSNLGYALINDEDYVCISSINALNNWSLSVMSSVSTSS